MFIYNTTYMYGPSFLNTTMMILVIVIVSKYHDIDPICGNIGA